MILLFLNFTVAFIPSFSNNVSFFGTLFTSDKHYPLVRNDLDVLQDILNTLRDITSQNHEPIYVLASSRIINDEIIQEAALQFKMEDLSRQILRSHHVDKRDGPPHHFLLAKYVIIADPVQYHLRPEDQRVIGMLATSILHQQQIGKHYRKLDYDFGLEKGIKVYIYEMVTQPGDNELNALNFLKK